MSKKKTKKQRRTAKQSKQEFTKKTRFYDLVRREQHAELKQLTENIRPYVRDGATVDWKHLRYFDFDKEKIRKPDFVLIIARFLLEIGKGDGLKCRMSVFIRYLASNEHSNFELQYRPLNTLIYRLFAYLDGGQKEVKKL